MAVIVQHKRTGGYLHSPWTYSPGTGHTDEVWPWLDDRSGAHHFASRGEAKAKIRSLYPEGKAPKNKELSFQTVA